MSEKNKFKCNNCGFEWANPTKTYDKCPECQSEDIKVNLEEVPSGSPMIGRGGRAGMGAGAPRVCKCHECGHESPKTRGVPCRQFKCPECGAPLCGSD
jgi:Zn finger protein HypA/HybF involved in hydrogenase expression